MRKLPTLIAFLATLILLVTGCGGKHSTNADVHKSKNFLQQVKHPKLPKDAYTRPGALRGTTLIHGEDNVDLSRVPLGTPAIGCYGYGSFSNCGYAAQRFPHSQRISITPSVRGVARILDVEPGDAVPSDAGGWARSMVNRGVFRPGIYASSWVMSQVRSSLQSHGLTHCTPSSSSTTCYILWVAAWDGNSGIPFGYDIHQYAGGNVRDYDTFASYVFTPSKPPVPNAPGCSTPSTSTSYCYGRFPDRKFYNSRKGDWCSKGCNERRTVEAYDYDRTHTGRATEIKQDRSRLAFLEKRNLYLLRARPSAINDKYYVRDREHEEYNRAFRGSTWHGSWRTYDF